MLLVPQNVRDEGGFTGTTLPDEHANLVVPHRARVEFLELKAHPVTGGLFLSWAGARERADGKQCFPLLEMSASYIQLAAIGQQDAYLTGSPQVTYFLGVYRRHTPFVLEAYDIPFLDQKLQYGQNHICRIPPKGDLVRSLMLKMTLPALQVIGTDWYWPIAPSVQNVATLIFNGKLSFANTAPFAGIDW